MIYPMWTELWKALGRLATIARLSRTNRQQAATIRRLRQEIADVEFERDGLETAYDKATARIEVHEQTIADMREAHQELVEMNRANQSIYVARQQRPDESSLADEDLGLHNM